MADIIDIGLAPRIQRLEDQFYEVNEKVHMLSQSHAESLLMMKTYMSKIDGMDTTLQQVKEAISEIKMPDKTEWEKEINFINRLTDLERSGKFTLRFVVLGGTIVAFILVLTWSGISLDKTLEILTTIINVYNGGNIPAGAFNG